MSRKLKSCKLHSCVSSRKDGLRCTRGVILNAEGNHPVIIIQGYVAELCAQHFKIVFNYIIENGPVETNEVICRQET